MGKFRSGVATVMAMWSCAAYEQAQDAPPAPQRNQGVSQRQVEELSRAAALLDQLAFSTLIRRLGANEQPLGRWL